ncbi:histidine phosphatase family protein [Ideonella sp.]|uniref:SixA phosphatase family protein n=1 Tax=Ideonella sp. TaxID=1929293 RepID=UPI002B479E41|nr:histidine phosphatase family protein [Ideonella sp.]HJV68620.1 histidine phosphatase family protein [Ideonella sp.]
MKTLLLIRHAKSGKDDPTLADRDRPLNDRGLRDASRMGERLARRGVHPDLILTSPALRALSTAQLIADALGHPRTSIVADERLYESTPPALLAIVRDTEDRHRTLMLVGHNPEISALAHRLAPDITEMPTCAVLECGFDAASWADVGDRHPVRVNLDSPKGLPGQ